MAGLPKARYPLGFKIHAASMAKGEGPGVAEIARRVPVSSEIIANWVKLAQEGRGFARQSAADDVDAENRRLAGASHNKSAIAPG